MIKQSCQCPFIIVHNTMLRLKRRNTTRRSSTRCVDANSTYGVLKGLSQFSYFILHTYVLENMEEDFEVRTLGN